MQTLAAECTNTVFTKTPKGREEIALRCSGLNSLQRRVLILLDGTKSLDAITAVMPLQELEEIVSFLAQQGLIVSAEGSAGKQELSARERSGAVIQGKAEPPVRHLNPAPALDQQKPIEPAPKAEITLIQDPATIRQVKDFMTTTAHTYLGLLGAEVIQRIERANDAAQLIAVVGHWHMALRGSKQGNRFAEPYLEQVKVTLTGSA